MYNFRQQTGRAATTHPKNSEEFQTKYDRPQHYSRRRKHRKEIKGSEEDNIITKEKMEDMNTHGDVVLKYQCDICKKQVMTKKGLKTHIGRMHEKSLQRLEREKKQQFSCDECDIKRSTEALLKSHKKIVHGNIKRNLSEMRRGPKVTVSPPSRSPPSKKVKEDDITLEEEDLEKRIGNLRRPIAKRQDPELIQSKEMEIDNLKRLLTTSGEVIATLENKNNNLNNKAKFYE